MQSFSYLILVTCDIVIELLKLRKMLFNIMNVFFSFSGATQRMWALQKLRKLMTSQFGPDINVNALLASPTGDGPDPDSTRGYGMVNVEIS